MSRVDARGSGALRPPAGSLTPTPCCWPAATPRTVASPPAGGGPEHENVLDGQRQVITPTLG
jgi:hypothetical protein